MECRSHIYFRVTELARFECCNWSLIIYRITVSHMPKSRSESTKQLYSKPGAHNEQKHTLVWGIMICLLLKTGLLKCLVTLYKET